MALCPHSDREIAMALPENPIMFANNPLDRAGHQRGNADWLAAQLASDTALVLPLWNYSLWYCRNCKRATGAMSAICRKRLSRGLARRYGGGFFGP